VFKDVSYWVFFKLFSASNISALFFKFCLVWYAASVLAKLHHITDAGIADAIHRVLESNTSAEELKSYILKNREAGAKRAIIHS
jgi:hypothetical protein